MSKIHDAFAAGNGKAFIPFITGGDPDLATTEKLIYALDEAGADLIEIGIPFSDPIAEGPVIEVGYARALAAGCTTDKLFDLVARVQKNIRTPLLFMTYYNPVFAYGNEKFTERCKEIGICGLIVPDLPFEERDELLIACEKQNLDLISLVAPTSKKRITTIAEQSNGFLYCVSSLGVTGVRTSLGNSAETMISQVKEVSDIPCAVGFGISNPEQARQVARFADGVIVGSAIVRLIEEFGANCVEPIAQYAKSIKDAISNP